MRKEKIGKRNLDPEIEDITELNKLHDEKSQQCVNSKRIYMKWIQTVNKSNLIHVTMKRFSF